MRVGFFGDGPWAARALLRLLEFSELAIVVVVGRFPQPDNELRLLATARNIPFEAPANVNSAEFLAGLESVGVDLFVSMSYDQIFRQDMLSIGRLGAINCHAGLLPYYRGRNPINWALINGERELGITVHDVVKDIDAGDIILQDRIPIEAEDDYATLLKKAHLACSDVLVEAVLRIARGTASRRPQNAIGFYVGKRRAGDEIVDWSQPSLRVHNFVRALVPPGPGARTHCDGAEFALLRTSLVPDAPNYLATCGEVVGRSDAGVVVKTGDNTLLISAVRRIGEEADCQLSEKPRWPIGCRLGRNRQGELDELRLRISELEQRLVALEKRT